MGLCVHLLGFFFLGHVSFTEHTQKTSNVSFPYSMGFFHIFSVIRTRRKIFSYAPYSTFPNQFIAIVLFRARGRIRWLFRRQIFQPIINGKSKKFGLVSVLSIEYTNISHRFCDIETNYKIDHSGQIAFHPSGFFFPLFGISTSHTLNSSIDG